jgi:N-acyl-D-amino-acid deacylase
MRTRILLAFALLFAMPLAGCTPPADDAVTLRVDVLISGGLIYDGSGEAPLSADLGLSAGKIAFIGDAETAGVTSADIVDATGLWITPGFIDAHSHAPLDEEYGKDARPYLHQGITTVVLGMDGGGSSDVAEHLAMWSASGIGTNALLFVGHGYVREAVMGRDDREPTAGELDDMRQQVRKAMEEGAFGLSTGLFYVPGTYASTDEVIDLAKVAAEFEGAIYDTHDRDLGAVYQGIGYEASVEEGIRITEESGLRGIFSHYNLQGAHNYGRASVGAKLLNDARDRGVDIWAAHHPYTATQSNLRSYTIPDWASAGGREEMIARFDEPNSAAEIMASTNAMLKIRGGADKILLVDPRPDLNGKTLADVAAERELAPAETVQWILREGDAAVMNLELYDHDNTRVLAQEAWMMTCTDGRTPRPDQPMTHPRTFGAFPKKMRHFVFEDELLTPEFVIRSFSGLAADFYRLPDRGYLREGYAADVVVLDPETYRDKATIDDPQQLSEGVVQLFVNGQLAIRDGVATAALAGVALRRPE